MKSFIGYICAISLVIMALGYLTRSGDEIKIYATGRDLRPLLENLNSTVSTASLAFRTVDTESDADVTVTFQRNIDYPGADAVSYVYRGQICVLDSVPDEALNVVLLHEILHCAGVPHDPNDSSSIMHPQSQLDNRPTESQMRELRRLSGITAPERVIAQLRALL